MKSKRVGITTSNTNTKPFRCRVVLYKTCSCTFQKESPTRRWYGGRVGASIVLRMKCALEAVVTCRDRTSQNIPTDNSLEEGGANASNAI